MISVLRDLADYLEHGHSTGQWSVEQFNKTRSKPALFHEPPVVGPSSEPSGDSNGPSTSEPCLGPCTNEPHPGPSTSGSHPGPSTNASSTPVTVPVVPDLSECFEPGEGKVFIYIS